MGEAEGLQVDKKERDKLELTIVDPYGEEILFKVWKTIELRKVWRAFGQRMGKKPECYRFFLNGERISEDQTPDDVGYKEGSLIVAERNKGAQEQGWNQVMLKLETVKQGIERLSGIIQELAEELKANE
jgi:small ubiquitin-related modifier